MTIQFSTTVRNNRLNALVNAIGANAVLKLFSGTIPTSCAAADSGTLLSVLICGSSYFAPAASSGAVTVSAISPDSAGNANGTPTHFRLYTSGGTCVMQGTAGLTGGTEDLIINEAISTTKSVSVTSWTITEPGA